LRKEIDLWIGPPRVPESPGRAGGLVRIVAGQELTPVI